MKVRLSRRAAADLSGIDEYTFRKWGTAQADRYLSAIEACFRTLEATPLLGRPCDDIRPGLRSIEQGEHVVYYGQDAKGILITRVLHRAMSPQRHPMGS